MGLNSKIVQLGARCETEHVGASVFAGGLGVVCQMGTLCLCSFLPGITTFIVNIRDFATVKRTIADAISSFRITRTQRPSTILTISTIYQGMS